MTAHQLRTPLSGMKWTLSLLLKGDLGPLTHDQKEYIQKTYDSNDRVIGLANSLLSVGEMKFDKMEYHFGQVSLPEMIDGIISEIASLISRKGIKLEFKKLTDIPMLQLDSDKIRGALQNIIENAVKYAKQGGNIEVLIKKEGDKVILDVADQGIGIPDEQKSHIFERFFRATNAMKTETEGSGLGLFIVKKIIENHKGTIRFESTENIGTTFMIELPIK